MKLSFITPITPAEKLACPRFIREFTASDATRATLTITGLGLYRAYLNGVRVGADYLTPGYNDYTAYLRCQTYDVTDMLQEENRMEVILGDGWYKGRFGLDGGTRNIFGSAYMLAVKLTVTQADGGEYVLETDESWRATASSIVETSIYDGEVRDDTRAVSESVPCVAIQPPCEPEEDDTPRIRQMLTLTPTLITSPTGEHILDFGQNMVGVLRFVNHAPRGTHLRMQFGEVLQNGCFYRDNLRSAKAEYIYTSDGVEKEVEPLFTCYGFRYAKLDGFDDPCAADFTGVVLYSCLPETLTVETDHPQLNQLMRNALWGQRGNFVDVPTDCPQRDERLGWTADTQVFVNTACYQMDCKAFYRKYMRDLRIDQQRYYQGDLPMFSPSLRGQAGHGGAVWADAGTIIPWNIYMNYGDAALLHENYPMMRDYVETLIAADKGAGGSHLVFNSFTFGDWLAQDGMTPQSLKGGTEDALIQGVYYMHSVELTAKAARVLGKDDDAARYEALADAIRLALTDEYITPNGRLAVDTQTAYALALYYGIYRDKEKLLCGLRKRLERDFYKITCGFTGAPLMLPVLLDNGLVDEAYRMLLTEEFPGWLYAVKLGATTIWERWNSLSPDGTISGTSMNSLNHYAYGSVCEAVYSRIMGLECVSPGWTAVRIAPKLNGQLRHSHIRYASPAGVYEVVWDIADDSRVTLTAVIPQGATAEIILPDHPDGLTETVGSGEHTYTWQPTKDYLHPFTVQSMLMDLLACPDAAALLQRELPALCGVVSDPSNEFRVQSPVTVSHTLPFLDPAQVLALDPMLRKVRW